MKSAAFAFSVLFFAAALFSFSVDAAEHRMIDVVVMKDGTVVKGTIRRLNTREVRIETLDGGEVVLPFKEVSTFEQELFAPGAGVEGQAAGSEAETEPFFDRHAWDVALETYHVTYKEPGIMEQTGLMAGVRGTYAYHNGWMFKAALGLGGGELDYSSRRTGSLSDIETAVLETRVLGGYDFIFSEADALTLYAGFGYRFLSNDSGGRRSTTGAFGYGRESNYFYSPIGIEYAYKASEKWRIRVAAEYDFFWMGRQESELSDVDPGFSDVTNDQNSGYGLRASIGAARDFGWGVLVIEPFVRYWNIGDSELSNLTFNGAVVGVGLEPANKTTEAGVRASLRF